MSIKETRYYLVKVNTNPDSFSIEPNTDDICSYAITEKELRSIITQEIYSTYDDCTESGTDRAKNAALQVFKALLKIGEENE